MARIPGLDDALMTLSGGQLTVRLTRGVWTGWRSGTSRRPGPSRRWPATHGAYCLPLPWAQEVQLAVAARPEAIDVGFWRAVLGYAALDDDNAVDPLGHGSTVWVQDLDPAGSVRHAMHVDVSVAREHFQARLAAALAAGGRVVRLVGMTPRPGRSPTAPATGSASPRGRTAPDWMASPGNVPAMSTRWERDVDCAHPRELATFWALALGYVEPPPPAGFD